MLRSLNGHSQAREVPSMTISYIKYRSHQTTKETLQRKQETVRGIRSDYFQERK